MYPLPKSEELEEYYDGKFREEVHSGVYYEDETLKRVFEYFTPEAIKRVKRVEKDLKKTDEILEVGCSVGYFLNAIVEHVESAYGTEWDSKARGYIENTINHPRIKTAKNPEDFNKKFDKIFMFHVLEHIEDPVEFLMGLKQMLNENGKIYIEVPNVDDVMVKTFDCKAFEDFYYKKAHIFNFNEQGLKYIFEKSDLPNYEIQFIERYDISNHFYWLRNNAPSGRGAYASIFDDELNEAYVKALVKAKQTDTLFAVIDRS
jgi:2-polyprenyl-3-methyl-5-hydroxy-6-metoxy-1,4-benzoquinol methylase